MPAAPGVGAASAPDRGRLAASQTRSGRPLPLRGERDFAPVFAGGMRARGQYVRVIALANGMPMPRLGMIIAKKRIRRAVDRNRLRRIVRESVARHHGMLQGMDIVITAEAGAVSVDNATLRADLERLWTSLTRRFTPGTA